MTFPKNHSQRGKKEIDVIGINLIRAFCFTNKKPNMKKEEIHCEGPFVLCAVKINYFLLEDK